MSPFPGLSRLTVCPTGLRELIGYIYRQFHRFCCRSALLKLYSSLVLPILDYNSLIWDPHLLKDIRQLDSVQTFACRMATKNWSASYAGSELQSICHLPSLKTRPMYYKLCFLYKSLNHLTHVPNNLFMYSAFLMTFSCFALEPTLTLSCFLLSVIL